MRSVTFCFVGFREVFHSGGKSANLMLKPIGTSEIPRKFRVAHKAMNLKNSSEGRTLNRRPRN